MSSHKKNTSSNEAMRVVPDLLALSIRQPWAWAIIHAGKDIENRNWYTRFRGRFLIHASKGCTRTEYLDACAYMDCYCGGVSVPPLQLLPRGGIVGEARLIGCVSDSESDWFVGDWGFELADVKPVPFIPCKGSLGFFCPQNVRDHV